MKRQLFVGLSLLIIVIDRVSKGWIAAQVPGGQQIELLGPYLRLVHGENRGGLFGLMQGSAPILGLLSIGVIVGLIVLHERETGVRPTLLTLGVAGLVGGAIGNLIDRFTLGYVLDFIDMGIGNSRFWTFNVADMGITIGICLLFADGLLPAKSRWRLS